MPKDLFAEKMVDKYQQLLLDNAGVKSVNVDGQSVTYSDLKADYQSWKNQLDASTGDKALIAQLDLSKF